MANHPHELLERFHVHLHEVWRSLSLSTPSGWVKEVGGLTCMATGSSSPSFNLALGGTRVRDPRTALAGAVERYGAADLRWLLKLQPDLDRDMVEHVQRCGIDLEEEPVYRGSTQALAARVPRASRALSIVTAGRETIEHAVQCVAEAFEADADDVRRELGPNLLTIPSFTVFVGYLGDEPVATSLLATTPSVRLAGVYSVATRPAHRGRGFGSALTGAALVAARAQGFQTAVLEPSPMGAAMYRRMGFEPLGTYLEAVM